MTTLSSSAERAELVQCLRRMSEAPIHWCVDAAEDAINALIARAIQEDECTGKCVFYRKYVSHVHCQYEHVRDRLSNYVSS